MPPCLPVSLNVRDFVAALITLYVNFRSSFLVCTELLVPLDTYGLVVKDRSQDMDYIFKYIILLDLKKYIWTVIPRGLQVISKTKKLQHTSEIPSV